MQRGNMFYMKISDFIFLYVVCSDFSVTYTYNVLKFNFDCKIH